MDPLSDEELHLKPGLLLLQSDHLTPLLVDSPSPFCAQSSIGAPEHNGAIKMLLTMSLDFFSKLQNALWCNEYADKMEQ